MATGGNKATFTSWSVTSGGALDSEQGTFTVQFNPKEIKSDKAAKWEASKEQGSDGAAFEYQKGEPRTLVMDLFFDTSMDGRRNVEEEWVGGLLALTSPIASGAGGGEKEHPPVVVFNWGNFEFTGIVDKISVQYLMFDTDGYPIRAKANVSMKEFMIKTDFSATGGDAWEGVVVDLSGASGAISARELTVITAQPGDTASTLAADNGTSYQAVCDANGIEDPTADLAGQEIVIPATDLF